MTIREILLSQLEGDGRPLAEVDLEGHTANTAYQILYRMIAAGEVSSRVERRDMPSGLRSVVVYRSGHPVTEEELRRQAGAVAYLSRKKPRKSGTSPKRRVAELLSSGSGRDFSLALIWATVGRPLPRRAA